MNVNPSKCSIHKIKLVLVWVLKLSLKPDNPQADIFNSLFSMSWRALLVLCKSILSRYGELKIIKDVNRVDESSYLQFQFSQTCDIFFFFLVITNLMFVCFKFSKRAIRLALNYNRFCPFFTPNSHRNSDSVYFFDCVRPENSWLAVGFISHASVFLSSPSLPPSLQDKERTEWKLRGNRSTALIWVAARYGPVWR